VRHRRFARSIELACKPLVERLEHRRLFSGGPDGGPDPIFPDEFEPNDSFAVAANLGTTNAAFHAGLTLHNDPQPGDVDYFRFTAATTGSIGVEIAFQSALGNMTLAAYNAAQQQIAFSNASTVANRRESVALNLTAGQTYYIRAAGISSSTIQPEYSLELKPLSLAFDWTMPARSFVQRDEFDWPVFPNTPQYARPNPIVINGVETPTFGVRLDAGASFAPGATFNWHVTSPQYTADLTGGPVLSTNLPEGRYDVTLSATMPNGGPTLTTARVVDVVDHLVVAMGDSLGSGEGNPNREQTYNIFGFILDQARWAQGDNDPAVAASHRRAHRSSVSGVARAVESLESSSNKSSVTFVFLNHSGATVPVGMLGPQDSIEPAEPGTDPAQVDQLAAIVGNRRIDGLVMSIGGNDAGFVDITARLLQAEPGSSNYDATIAGIWSDAANYRNNLLNARYPSLRDALTSFNIGQIYLMEYPDLTRDSTGGTAQQILHDIQTGLEVDRNELDGAREHVLEPLARGMANFARRHGWHYVNDIAAGFANNGYGSWLVTATESVTEQGPVVNVHFPTPEEKARTTGTLHPNYFGQNVPLSRVNLALTRPNLVTTSLAVSPNAFVTGATDGYALTVKNTSLTASAHASAARIYVSPDATVNTSDALAAHVSVPALAPGQSIMLTGVLPHMTFRDPDNLAYVGAVLDVTLVVNESNEADNLPMGAGVNDVVQIRPERQLIPQELGPWTFFGPVLQPENVYSAGLGPDELIGAYDIDLWALDVTAANQRFAIDIDAVGAAGLDTHLRVYPMSGNVVNTNVLLASNDDGRAPGEPTAHNGESFLRHTFAAPGRYCVVVAHAVNGNVDPMQTATRNSGIEGNYTIQANVVPASPVLVTGSEFVFATAPQRLTFSFNSNVGATLSASDLQLTNLSTNQPVPTANIAVAYDATTNSGTFTFPGYTYGALPDGNYRATLPAGSVQDPDGNALAADVTMNFFFLQGDANHDGRVNLADFNLLAANFGQSPRDFTQGDFTYDGTVNLSDFNVLAGRFGGVVQSPGARDADGDGRDDDELPRLLG
jgi:hypothetical protein